MSDKKYGGFWIRTGAAIIDTIVLLMVIGPVLTLVYGKAYWMDETFVKGFWDIALNYILPPLAVIIFWYYKSATPGKMLTGLTIVDAETGGKPTTGQLIGRYLAYYVSAIPLCLGFIWVGIDARKQGWHDKLAGTVVIKSDATGVRHQ